MGRVEPIEHFELEKGKEEEKLKRKRLNGKKENVNNNFITTPKMHRERLKKQWWQKFRHEKINFAFTSHLMPSPTLPLSPLPPILRNLAVFIAFISLSLSLSCSSSLSSYHSWPLFLSTHHFLFHHSHQKQIGFKEEEIISSRLR